jgi:transposase-like protein
MSSQKDKKSKEEYNEKCPHCGTKEYVGFLGGSSCRRYFCRNCCREFSVKKGKTESFSITVNGTLE